MSLFKKVAALVAGAVIVVGAHGLALAQGASPDDVARFLAGMQPSAGSPIARADAQSQLAAAREMVRLELGHAREAAALQDPRLVRAESEGLPAEHAVLHVQRSRLSLRQRVLSVGQHLSDERPGAGRRDSRRHRTHDRFAAANSAVDRHVAAAELLHHASTCAISSPAAISPARCRSSTSTSRAPARRSARSASSISTRTATCIPPRAKRAA